MPLPSGADGAFPHACNCRSNIMAAHSGRLMKVMLVGWTRCGGCGLGSREHLAAFVFSWVVAVHDFLRKALALLDLAA
jgi:hypothetical protein